MASQVSTPSYEELYKRMQEIVARLEAGDLPLDEAVALYEEGMRLAAACQRILDNAELRVQQLQTGVETYEPYED